MLCAMVFLPDLPLTAPDLTPPMADELESGSLVLLASLRKKARLVATLGGEKRL